MMRVLLLSLACALAVPATANSQTRRHGAPATIPTQFRGEWNTRLSACGTADWDPLSINTNQLIYDEYSGEVQRIIRHSSRAITVYASYSAEGHEWDRVNRLIVSGSGKELIVKRGQSVVARYQRCPSKGRRSQNA